MRRRRLATISVIVLLLIAAVMGLWVQHHRAGLVRDRLESRMAAGAESFDFAAEAPFAWDRMFVFGPYTTQWQVEKALGFPWPDYRHTSINDSKARCLVIFVANHKVVYWYEQPRTVALGWLANYEGYDRANATFVVDRTNSRPALRPPLTATAPATRP